MQALPLEIIQEILGYTASLSPSSALSVCLVCKATLEIGKRGLSSYLSIRSRQNLITKLITLPENAHVKAIFVNNRDSSHAGPLDMLQQPLRAALCSWSDTDSSFAELAQDLAKKEPAKLLAMLLERSRNVESLYFWEPFSINYPPEISEVNHISPYPLDTYTSIFQAMEPHLADQAEATNSTCAVPTLRELTISFLALQPGQFTSKIRGIDRDVLTFSNLTHLHLHWPVVTTELVESLGTLPKLAHVRLSRPGPNGLVAGVKQWLNMSSDHGDKLPSFKFHRIVIELGLYLETNLIEQLETLERASSVSVRGHKYPRLLLLERDRDRTRFTGQWLQFDQVSSWQEWIERLQGRPACWIQPCYCDLASSQATISDQQ